MFRVLWNFKTRNPRNLTPLWHFEFSVFPACFVTSFLVAKISDHWLTFYGKSPFGVPKSSKMRAFGGLWDTLACLWASRGPKEGFLGAFGPHFGHRGCPTYDFGTKNGAHGPPSLPKWGQNCSKIHPKFVPKSIRFFDMRLDHFGLPKWMQIW